MILPSKRRSGSGQSLPSRRSRERHSADVPFIPLPLAGTPFEGFHANDDIRALHAQGSGQFGNGSERWALDAASNQADVGSIQAAVEGKAFLRTTVFLTDFSQGVTPRSALCGCI